MYIKQAPVLEKGRQIFLVLEINILEVLLNKKKKGFSGPPSSVSNAPHLSFFQTLIKKR